MSSSMPESLSFSEKLELLQLLEEKERRKKYNAILQLFPDQGPLRRELYPRHMEFFEAGAKHRERGFVAGNRCGKTVSAGFEIVCHATGNYPEWWKGKTFNRPVKVLAAGDTSQSTRDIIQDKLLGPIDDQGCGLIPKDSIAGTTRKSGVAEAVESIRVKHTKGGESLILLRSSEQGRKLFQGIEVDVVWLDEEPPEDVYTESLVRTMTTNGIVMLTFTPLQGLTPLVMNLMGEGFGTE